MTTHAPSQADKAERFLALHRGDTPLLMPNPWDPGSARLLATMGFAALATTSSGFAGTMGRLDGTVTRDEALAHAAAVVESVDVPVSADLENCFADDPAGVAATVRGALAAGLAGCSVEDYAGAPGDNTDANGIYERGLAVERVAAAVEAAHTGPVHLVVTARAENLIRGSTDLDDTIERLQAYQEAGADVVFGPRIVAEDDLRRLVSAVDCPVSVLVLPGAPTIAELGEIGVGRISVGGGFFRVALGAVVEAGRELLDKGTYGFWQQAGVGAEVVQAAFAPRRAEADGGT
jgi:2-methylisocitrate lyase-like PEP mutase family enzyme